MSTQKKFKAGDKVVWSDIGYWSTFFAHTDPKQILTISHYGDEDDGLVFFENLSDINGDQAGVFDYRFTLVESAQESIEKPAETPSNQWKTCPQNYVSCKDKETPVLEENDENAWFKRGEFPPAGTVCEVIDEGEWRQTVVVGVDSEGFAVYESPWSDIPYDGESNPLRFRPIKTAEQIAEEGRQKAISEMESLVNGYGLWWICAKLYAAGYRLAGEGK